MKYFKITLFKLYMLYFEYFPIKRGKFFISKVLEFITGVVIIKTYDGIWLVIRPTSSMDLSYFQKENISNELIKNEIDKLSPGEIFVDIGANIGYYSFFASRKLGNEGSVYAFEPSKREYLRFLIGQSLNKSNNIISLNCAASDHNGHVEIQFDKYHTGLNRIYSFGQKQILGYRVVSLRVEDLISVPIIHLVKIDVEGAEFQVLKGMRILLQERKILKLIIEITDSYLRNYNSSKDELYEYLNSFGYRPLFRLEEWQYDEIFTLE